MKLLIDIPEEDIPKVQGTMEIHLCFCDGQLCQCDYPFETEYCKDEEPDFVQPHKKIEVDLVKFDTPYTDEISRQAAIDAMREETCMSCWDAKDILKHLPSVSTEKTGHWRPIYQGDKIINYRCSECELGDTNVSTNLYGWDYCRRCGAKMEV